MADTSSAKALTFPFDTHAVRALLRDGEPWFVAADVCAALGLDDTSKAASRLDDDERGTNTVRTPFGDQQMLVINESGLYSLVLTSRKPEAKRFKKWVTSEVLPAIRRTGAYSEPGVTQPAVAHQTRVQYLADVARTNTLSSAALVDLAYRLAPAAQAQAPAPTRATQPAANADEYATVESLAPRVGLTARKLNNLLSRSRWQIWNTNGWVPTRLGFDRAMVGDGGIAWRAFDVQELVAASEGDSHAAMF